MWIVQKKPRFLNWCFNHIFQTTQSLQGVRGWGVALSFSSMVPQPFKGRSSFSLSRHPFPLYPFSLLSPVFQGPSIPLTQTFSILTVRWTFLRSFSITLTFRPKPQRVWLVWFGARPWAFLCSVEFPEGNAKSGVGSTVLCSCHSGSHFFI